MNRNEQEAVYRIVDALTRPHTAEESFYTVLATVCSLANAPLGQIVHMKGPGPDTYLVGAPNSVTFSAMGESDTAFFGRDFNNHLQSSPYISHVPTLKKPVNLFTEVVGTRTWLESDWYRHVYKRLSLREGASLIQFDRNGKQEWGFGISVDSKLTQRQRRLLAQLMPAIGRGLSNIISFYPHLSSFEALQSAVEAATDLLLALESRPNGQVELVCASGGARQVLRLDRQHPGRNLHLRELFSLARSAPALQSKVDWEAPAGQRFRLSTIRRDRIFRSEVILVRLTAQSDPSANLTADLAQRWGLTAREIEVFKHMALGLANKQIAQRMNVSFHTVRAHLRNINAKLGVDGRVEAIARVQGKPNQKNNG
ncbi:MAG TPA: LuxR C-terminal-related transcriptional regulator [Planctomycetota bacterium]|nr:LuxR C-terminal-related transcriptional regulator [Planctomycetota bacterium]